MTAKRGFLKWAPVPRLRAALRGSGLFSPAGGAIVLARAPGRLDVMGGIGDYSGALVCEMPLGVAAAAAVQGRDDGQIVCRSAQEQGAVTVDAAAVDGDDPVAVRRLFDDAGGWARYVAGCVWWLWRQGPEDRRRRLPRGGCSILIDSDVPLGGGVSSSAAVEVATMTALCALWDVKVSPLALAAACQVVENRVVGAPCGVMDQVTSCLGQEGSLLQIHCQAGDDGLPARVLGPIAVPAGFAFVGIHSGVRHEVKGDPYTDTRVAAFIAQKMLSTLEAPDLTRGHLANVDRLRYRRELRGRLPVSITGREFLDRYGGTNDAVTRVDPDKTYPVRAAASHHVNEDHRVRSFVAHLGVALDCISERDEAGPRAEHRRQEHLRDARRARRADDPAIRRRLGQWQREADQIMDTLRHYTDLAMARAGRLMYASHHSYGLRANLGHSLTDKLVQMVRQRGIAQGFFGAKISGGGCGGTVAVLLRDEPAVHSRLEEIRRQYTLDTGRATVLFVGTSPGAADMGMFVARFEDLP